MLSETPARLASCRRISAITSVRERASSCNSTSISELLTGSTCSSSSARPVRRAVYCTSGTRRMSCSATAPILLLSSREVPAGVYRLTVKLPSLNGGKNSVPKRVATTKDAITSAVATPMTMRGFDRPKCNTFWSCFFNHCTKPDSLPSLSFDWGNK